MLRLDGVYEHLGQSQRKPRLRRSRAPTSAQLTELAGKIAHRVCRHLTRKGWLEGEHESVFPIGLCTRVMAGAPERWRLVHVTIRSCEFAAFAANVWPCDVFSFCCSP